MLAAERRASIAKTAVCPEDPCGARQICRLTPFKSARPVLPPRPYDDRPSDGAATQTTGLFAEANPEVAVNSTSQLRHLTGVRGNTERRQWQKERAGTATTEDGWLLMSDGAQMRLSGLTRSMVYANEQPPGDVVSVERDGLLVTAGGHAPGLRDGNLLTGEWTPMQLAGVSASGLLLTTLL